MGQYGKDQVRDVSEEQGRGQKRPYTGMGFSEKAGAPFSSVHLPGTGRPWFQLSNKGGATSQGM